MLVGVGLRKVTLASGWRRHTPSGVTVIATEIGSLFTHDEEVCFSFTDGLKITGTRPNGTGDDDLYEHFEGRPSFLTSPKNVRINKN